MKILYPGIALLLGCATTPTTMQTAVVPVTQTSAGLPASVGERASGFGYIPLDGLAIREGRDPATCAQTAAATTTYREPKPLLESLPDVSVRFAVASFDASGALSFGPAKVTAAGGLYRAVLDYVNVDVLPVEFLLRKFVRTDSGIVPRRLLDRVSSGESVVGYEARIRSLALNSEDSTRQRELVTKELFDHVTIPVYVGLGMRLSADIQALKGGISLTSLGAIAAEAQANGLSGTLTVQTLGVTGKSIATALPLPSKLDQTTVENGILALGSNRAVIYGGTSGSSSDVTITPRVVGLYSPVGSDPSLINAIYSELSKEKPIWFRPCPPKS